MHFANSAQTYYASSWFAYDCCFIVSWWHGILPVIDYGQQFYCGMPGFYRPPCYVCSWRFFKCGYVLTRMYIINFSYTSTHFCYINTNFASYSSKCYHAGWIWLHNMSIFIFFFFFYHRALFKSDLMIIIAKMQRAKEKVYMLLYICWDNGR